MWTPTPATPAVRSRIDGALALEVIEHGAGVFLLDAAFRITFVNEAFERAAGAPGAEVVGRSLWEVFPEASRPDSRFWREYHRAMRERVPVRFEEHYAPTGLWSDVSVHPLRDGGLAVFFLDITAQKRAEEALRAERDFIGAVLDTIANLVVVLDLDGRIVRFNGACERLTGWTAQEVLGRSVFELLIPEEDVPGARAVFERLRMGDFPNVHRNRWRTRDGVERLVAWANTAIPEEDGTVRYVIATGVDVTERERALAALAASEARVEADRRRREAAQAVHAAIADDLARLTAEEEIARSIGARLTEHLEVASCAVADLEGERATIRAAYTRPGAIAPAGVLRVPDFVDGALEAEVRAGRTIVLRDAQADPRVDRARCEALGVRAAVVVPFLSRGVWRHAFWVGTPEPRDWRPDEVQLVEEVAARFFPRIERARAEEALRRSEQRLRRLVDAIPIGVVEGDAGGRILDANGAFLRIIARSRAELEAGALRWDVLTPPEHLEADARAVHEARARGVSAVYEKAYALPDGGRVPVLLACATFGGDDRLIAFAVDITDRKRAEEALRESDRRKSEFLAVLSHELRNPLAPIRNGVALLERAPDAEAARRAVGILRRQADHLARLVDDLLDMSRITHGKFELQLARVDAREIVRRAWEDVRGLFEPRAVELSLAEGPEPLWVEADPARLAQMVGNLLSNALKFARPGGHVRVGGARRGACCEVSVTDDGIGIDPADLERIFEPFVQSRQPRGGQGGMGIGLALVRDLAVRMGGTVRARSAGPGQGATFVISLPLAAAPARAGASPAPAAAAGLSILIVEDNEDAAATLADLLRLGGHVVATAGTGRDGLAAADAAPPDALICDLGLPDASGLELVRAFRARVPDLFAVALTGYAQPLDRDRALAAGFDAHLPKPPPLDALDGLLREAARRRGKA